MSEKGIILKSGMAQHVDKSLTNAAYVCANTCVRVVMSVNGYMYLSERSAQINARFSLQAFL